ncbi:MAG: hypothetical protein IKM59_07670 [Oscillospiraceae bacterium]|nr:hypothetical protein [Oscillospiraceae bacterium]
MTKTIWEHRKTLSQAHLSMLVMEDSSYLFDNLPIPLHSGAEKLYDEIS